MLAATGLGLFMVFLDAMIANLALPDIQDEFGGGESTLQWVVVAYSVGMALFIMPSGTIADWIGRRLVFLISVGIFSLASLAAGLAPEMWVLVSTRVIQGLAGAAIAVTSLALVSDEFQDRGAKARAIGTWTGIAAVGIALGPTLGGFLTEEASWRWVFFMNVPVGAVVTILALKFLHESKDPVARRFDPVGQAVFVVMIVALSVGVISGPHKGWTSPLIVSCFAVFLLSTALFIPYEHRRRDPMLDVRLFQNSTYAWAVASIFALYFLVYGAQLMITQYWQNVKGLSPIESGMLLLPFALVMVFVPPRTGKLTARIGPGRPATTGLFLLFVGAVVIAATIHVHWLASAAFTVIATGVAFANPALTTLSMSSAPPDRAGMASGIVSAQRALGSTVGYAVMGSVLAASLGITLSGSLETEIPDTSQREAVAEAIIDNASPYAYAAEIGPGEPIPHESTEVDDEILSAAEDDFITGMQIALALGALLVFIMWLMGKLRFARPREEVAVAVDVSGVSGDIDIGVAADSDVDVSVDIQIDRS